MKILRILLVVLFLSPAAYAADGSSVQVKVKGMVCDFCAQSVLKVFEKNEDVETVDVDLDTQVVTIHLAPDGEISQQEIEDNIYYAGYDFVGIVEESE